MSKRKRTIEEVEAMQEKAARFQDNIGNVAAAKRIESLRPTEYAAWRKIEIVWDPVRKRRRTGTKAKANALPPGYARRTEIVEWTDTSEKGGRRIHREVKTEILKKE
jgi:hypothetical protein